MNSKIEELKKEINKSIMIYIIGCCFFILVALGSIWFGYYIIRYHNEHELPFQLIILSMGGGLLLWEIFKSFRIKVSLPSSFRRITEQEYPTLFGIINEVTTTLNISSIRNVYICPDAVAAVFIQPQIRNLIFEPQKNLVVGMAFLTQMDDDEIRAMLYHEFGHYVQEEMKNSVSVYAIGQFSRSFVAVNRGENYEGQMKLQLLIFTYFTINMCNIINKAYLKLSKQMEYEADDVAVRFVGAKILQRTLEHAVSIKYNYEVVQWGVQQLQAQNIGVDNEYLALYFVCNYAKVPQSLISDEILNRIKRLEKIESDERVIDKLIQTEAYASELLYQCKSLSQICSAMQFAQWLREGYVIYTQQRLFEISAGIEIHLDKEKYDVPYFDSLYKILLDDKEIGTGNFKKGYTLKRRISSGKHKLTVYAPVEVVSTPFEFEVEQGCLYRIEMDYEYYKKKGVYDVFGKKIEQL